MRYKIYFLALIFSALVLEIACNSKNPGFKTTKNGLSYKFIKTLICYE